MHKNIYIEDIPSIELGGQTYSSQDTTLITSFSTGSVFNPDSNYIEYYIFNGNKQIVDSTPNLRTYRIYDNQVNIFPETDLEGRAFNQGQYYTLYHFFEPLLSSSIEEPYYISEISSDRTELRLNSTDILGGDIVDGAVGLIQKLETLPYYEDFYLNFGANSLVIANNILLDDTDPDNVSILIKLYEPLPDTLNINAQCWAVEKIAESRAYLINIQTVFDTQDNLIHLAGPNLNIPVKNQENKATDFVTGNSLKSSTSTDLKNQLSSVLNVPGVELNTDYSDFSNFIFFSSARTRLENYYYKLGLLEEYNYSASLNTESGSYYNSGSLSYWENQITDVITNFDGFEYYLYYESGSTAWPKSNDTPPYINVPTTSSEGQAWLTSRLSDADTYDNDNKDLLTDTIPLFIQNDATNTDYELFVQMAGQLYDEIWLYLRNVTEKYNTVNGVNKGLSKDLVGQALKDLGIKLYQNNFTSDDLFSTYLGITPSGSLLPNTGQELIETYVTASATGSLVPINDLSSEVYKRIYHNLPYLLKKKGTVEGLRALINIYGIPDTILRINEFGGKDKNSNTWDYYQNEYDYAFNTSGSGFVNIPWIYDYLPEYKAFLSSVDSNGFTEPSESEKFQQNLFIYNLKTGLVNGTNVWDSLDMLRLFANSNEDLTTIDYKDPTLPLGQLVNSPTFSQNIGLAGDGTFSTYYQTNFNPSIHATNMIVGNGHIGFYRTTATTIGPVGGANYHNGGIVASSTSRDSIGIAPDNIFTFALQNPTNNAKSVNLGEQPVNVLVSVKRGGDVSSSKFYGYIDTTQKSNNSPTVLALPTTSYKALNGRNDNNAMIFSGASLTFAQMEDLKAAIETYLAAI